MIFSNKDDVSRSIETVKKELNKRNISVEEKILIEIVKDIMNISYSKGGDYSEKVICNFARVYIEEELYKKFFDYEA